MATFIVTEVVQYSVEADTAEDAIEELVQTEEPDAYFQAVTDRYATAEDGEVTGSDA